MEGTISIFEVILGIILILSAFGIVFAKKPVNSTLCFLLTLIVLATIYLQLAAPFIAAMQIWVYAGGILVIFMFVIVLFQDAHVQILKYTPKVYPTLLLIAAFAFLFQLVMEGNRLLGLSSFKENIGKNFGTVQSIGEELYVAYFFPFEAVVLLFLVAVIGSIFIGRRES